MNTVIPALDAFPPAAASVSQSGGSSSNAADGVPASDSAPVRSNSLGGPAPQFAGYLIGHLGGRRAYHCECGRPVFFQNSVCVNSGHALGYEIDSAQVRALTPGAQPGTWQLHDQTGPDEPLYRYCSNLDSPIGCNWLIRQTTTGNSAPTLCLSCGLNRMIPDLSIKGNGELWRKIELAKRRLVATLVGLDLPVRSRLTADPQRGLAFDFMQTGPVDRVMTGHDDGVITLNIDEADDAKREAMRTKLHEPYRTLLGHLRHEVGHYYWDLLIDNSPWLDTYRQLFGDERADYQDALKAHYANGAPPDWALHLISAYAAMHPWEDWAETWAHYLHMVDTLDTALSFGLDPRRIGLDYQPFTRAALYAPDDPDADRFLSFINRWSELTGVMNELSRSMGQLDFYPFVLPAPVVAKLQFIHIVLRSVAEQSGPS